MEKLEKAKYIYVLANVKTFCHLDTLASFDNRTAKHFRIKWQNISHLQILDIFCPFKFCHNSRNCFRINAAWIITYKDIMRTICEKEIPLPLHKALGGHSLTTLTRRGGTGKCQQYKEILP